MSEFEREDRYLVIKKDDYRHVLTNLQQQNFYEFLALIEAGRQRKGKKPHNYVVVSDDWPMYEDVWAMIQAYVETGNYNASNDAIMPSSVGNELAEDVKTVLRWINNSNEPFHHTEHARCAINSLKAELLKREWISVEDPPEEDCKVLTYHEEWGYGVGNYKASLGFDSPQLLVPFVCCTHYSYLEPPTV